MSMQKPKIEKEITMSKNPHSKKPIPKIRNKNPTRPKNCLYLFVKGGKKLIIHTPAIIVSEVSKAFFP